MLGLAGSIAGGVFSAIGANRQQRASERMADKQMEFQRQMSNTAYTRAAHDLNRAGLNRVLAIGSPASSPGGAMGQAQNILGSGVTGAATAASTANAIATAQHTKLQNDILGPEAHRARLILEGQKYAEKVGRNVLGKVKTFPLPDAPRVPKGTYIGPDGKPVGKWAQTSALGRAITRGMNKLSGTGDEYGNNLPRKPISETPATAREVGSGTVIQHLEAYVEDYVEKHGKAPTEKQIRDEYERVKKYY